MPKGIYNRTEEHCKNISKGLKGHLVSRETRKKIGKSAKEMDRSYMQTLEYKRKMSNVQRKVWATEKSRANRLKGIRRYWRKPSSFKKRSDASKKLWKDPDYRQKTCNSISKALIGRKNSTETCEKLKVAQFKRWQNEKYKKSQIQKILKGTRKRPTSLESTLLGIIDTYELPYKYVGNGSFLIGTKNPDFISTDKTKKCIEVHNFYHHPPGYRKERATYFLKYGWETAFVNENEIKDVEKVLLLIS